MTFEDYWKSTGLDAGFEDCVKDAARSAWDYQQTEIDALRKECAQLRADLYKALDYIHEGEE